VGTRRIRGWRPTGKESRLADTADEMAAALAALGPPAGGGVDDQQLIHGDFWDDNVLFDDRGVALIADFDFMGRRPRIDDLALTLYFTSQDLLDLAEEPERLGPLVSAYESGLVEPLTDREREALPVAMARQPLWSIAVWVALLDDEASARRHLAGTAAALAWGLAADAGASTPLTSAARSAYDEGRRTAMAPSSERA